VAVQTKCLPDREGANNSTAKPQGKRLRRRNLAKIQQSLNVIKGK